MKIAILGGSGCVGKNLISSLSKSSDIKIIASFESCTPIPTELKRKNNIQWHNVDLSNINSIQGFLDNCEILIYLIHSLNKKTFLEMDNQFAKNTAVASKNAGIKKIIYMGGIIPQGQELSDHLKGRMETGKFLHSTQIPLTEVRASIVIAPCSSSFDIVYRIANKFPIIIGPNTLNSICAPIYIEDIVKVFLKLIGEKPDYKHKIISVGSQNIKYLELVKMTRLASKNKKLRALTVPHLPTGILARIYGIVFGTNYTLADHLFDSLKNDTKADIDKIKQITGSDPKSVTEAIKLVVAQKKKI